MTVSFTIVGEPMTWARAGKYGKRQYTPTDRVHRMQVMQSAWGALGIEPFGRDVQLVASLQFYFERPKAHFGTGKNAGVMKPQAAFLRPGGGKYGDLDNLIKLVKDALSAVAYHDDAQIVEYESTFKAFCRHGEMPRTEVSLRIWVPDQEELGVGEQAFLPDTLTEATNGSRMDEPSLM